MSNLIAVEKGGECLPVHPDALAEHLNLGWMIAEDQTLSSPELDADDGNPPDDELRAAIETLTGKAPHHKTGRAKLIEILDVAKAARQDETASNGLTRREIEADLESANVEFDPRDSVEDLAALRDMAREERDQ